jgi:hypothetical protein
LNIIAEFAVIESPLTIRRPGRVVPCARPSKKHVSMSATTAPRHDDPDHRQRPRTFVMTRLLRIAAAAIVLLAAAGWMLLRFGPAQWSEPAPGVAELRTHWQRAVRWMREHEALVLSDGNPMLWRMMREAAERMGDESLAELARKHRARYYGREPVDAWVMLLDPRATVPKPKPAGLDTLPGYMKFFSYAMSCDAVQGESPEVKQEMQLEQCSAVTARRVLRHPKCVTHQLMGFMLMHERRCGDPARVAAMTRQLQDRVVDELALDPVVHDAHLQRVMMLYWTGAPERIEPVWLNRLLRAQRADGS